MRGQGFVALLGIVVYIHRLDEVGPVPFPISSYMNHHLLSGRGCLTLIWAWAWSQWSDVEIGKYFDNAAIDSSGEHLDGYPANNPPSI